MGSRIKAYLGLLPPTVKTPLSAAEAAMTQANMEADVRAKTTLLNEALLSALIAAGARGGRDTSGVRDAWHAFQRAADSGNSRERQRTFRAAKRTFRRGFGRRLTREWPMASIGAAWALMAILSWDQATEEGPYTIQDRDHLTRPWVTVSSLPI